MQLPRESRHGLTVAIRVDSGAGIGGGHAMRCLALAQALLSRSCRVLVLHAEDAGDSARDFEAAGCVVRSLGSPGDESADALATADAIREVVGRADWLVVDHYGLGAGWERVVSEAVDAVCALDDLVRPHDSELLVDSSLAVDGLAQRYAYTSPAECVELIGPAFAMLRPEFAAERLKAQRDSRQVRRVVAAFGAGESFGLPDLLIDVAPSFADLHFTLILGPYDTRAVEYADRAESAINVTALVNPANMAHELAAADIVVGTGGVGLLERVYLGVPSLTVVVAENQRPQAEAAAAAGVTRIVGDADGLDANALTAALGQLAGDGHALAEMSRRCLKLTGGEPGAQRVAWELVTRAALCCGPWRLRVLARGDLDRVREWRNSERVRSVMRTHDEITPDEHESWYEQGRSNPQVRRVLLEREGQPLGYLALDAVSEKPGVWEWGFYLGEHERPDGSGDALGALGLAYAFERVGAREVLGRTLPGNLGSDAFHERMGFALASGDESVGCVWMMTRAAWELVREATFARVTEVEDGC